VINSSGAIGVYFNNIYSQSQTAPYYLIDNGNGTFTNGSANYLPTSLESVFPAYTASALIDVTGNGLADLIIRAEDLMQGPSLIYLNPGNGDFRNVTPIALPAPALPVTVGLYSSQPSGPSILDIEPVHISSQKYDDLVVISTTGNYEGYEIQILVNDGSVYFTDETPTRLVGVPLYVTYPATTVPQSWIVRSFIVDLNGDGYPDIVTHGNGTAPSQVFLNNGEGVFDLAYSVTNTHIMAVASIAGEPTLIELNGNLVPFESPQQSLRQSNLNHGLRENP
jgi:hypothetical protein